MFSEQVTYAAALFAGLLSFFSPCVLPLIPAYFTFITGLSLDDLTADGGGFATQKKVLAATFFFVMGFSFVFVLLGASASLVGGLLYNFKDVVRIGGGVLILVFGLHLTGILRLPFLNVEKRVHIRQRPLTLFGAFFIGMAFGAGWSPCVGPQLGAILAIAMGKETVGQGMRLLAVYSAGLALPFFLMSFFVSYILSIVKKATRYMQAFNAAAGGLLILLGVLLMADKLTLLTGTG